VRTLLFLLQIFFFIWVWHRSLIFLFFVFVLFLAFRTDTAIKNRYNSNLKNLFTSEPSSAVQVPKLRTRAAKRKRVVLSDEEDDDDTESKTEVGTPPLEAKRSTEAMMSEVLQSIASGQRPPSDDQTSDESDTTVVDPLPKQSFSPSHSLQHSTFSPQSQRFLMTHELSPFTQVSLTMRPISSSSDQQQRELAMEASQSFSTQHLPYEHNTLYSPSSVHHLSSPPSSSLFPTAGYIVQPSLTFIPILHTNAPVQSFTIPPTPLPSLQSIATESGDFRFPAPDLPELRPSEVAAEDGEFVVAYFSARRQQL
jgi:hypothetical protein